jgi:hypothetical protein
MAAESRLPRGYWAPDRVRPILEKVLTTRYEVDLSSLRPGERVALRELVAAGRVLQELAEDTEHHQALPARRRLVELHEQLGRPAETEQLLELYEIFQGPIATTLDNELLPFLPVDPFAGGRNVYPWGITADEVESFFTSHPDRRAEILELHTVVRRTTPRSLQRDLATLRRHAVLDALHPGLRARLEQLAVAPEKEALYAVPYSVRWPDRLLEMSGGVWRAAAAVAEEDPDLAAFLRQRSRDLLTDDNEAGDAAWVRGSFTNLDVVVGAHEQYDDALFGAKAFFGMAILLRDTAGTEELRGLMRRLQAIEDALPIERHGTVSSEIPVGSFDLIAAFGQARGTLAEILPNDPVLMRKYGRKIVLRRNTTVHPDPFSRISARWRAAMAPVHHDDITAEGVFRHIIWHEVGHYVGPDNDQAGRPVEAALAEDASVIEELKAELAATFACLWFERAGALHEHDLQGVIAYTILTGVRPVRPLRSQPYPTMSLMKFNHFLEMGFVRIENDVLHVDRAKAWSAIESMLAETLAIQDHGSRAESSAFIERLSTWDERHERIAARLRAVERYRMSHDRFAVLDG